MMLDEILRLCQEMQKELEKLTKKLMRLEDQLDDLREEVIAHE